MTFESDFHEIVENTLTKRAWKILGDEIGLHRRRQLMQTPSRASNAEILVFERLTQIPADVLISHHNLGADVLTQNEVAMHTQRNEQHTILPPYGETSKAAGTTGASTTTVANRNRRSIATAAIPTT